MTVNEAKRLRRGDRVAWQGDIEDAGTVWDVSSHSIGIIWDCYRDAIDEQTRFPEGRWAALVDIAPNLDKLVD